MKIVCENVLKIDISCKSYVDRISKPYRHKKKRVLQLAFNGANEVDIYNFLALLTIDTNINQFIKVYHIFNKLQYRNKKSH